jgi:hypothetical protein
MKRNQRKHITSKQDKKVVQDNKYFFKLTNKDIWPLL